MSILIAAVIGVLVILIVQQSWGDVADVADAMWSYGLFNRNSLAFILGRATPLIFAGLAVAIAFKAGLFNIGVEGQYAIGALTAGYVGYQLVGPHRPAPAPDHPGRHGRRGALGRRPGPAQGLPGGTRGHLDHHDELRGQRGPALPLSGAIKDPNQRGAIAQQQTPDIEPTAQVGSMVPFFNSIGFDFRGSAPVTWFFVLAIVAAVLYALTVRRTRFGLSCGCSAPTPGRPSRPGSAATP